MDHASGNGWNFTPSGSGNDRNNPVASSTALVIPNDIGRNMTSEQYIKAKMALQKLKTSIKEGEVQLDRAFEETLNERIQEGLQAQQQLQALNQLKSNRLPVQYAPQPQALPPPVSEHSSNTFQAWNGQQSGLIQQQSAGHYRSHAYPTVPQPQPVPVVVPAKHTGIQDYYAAALNAARLATSGQTYTAQTQQSTNVSNFMTRPHQRTTSHQSYPKAYVNQIQQHIRPAATFVPSESLGNNLPIVPPFANNIMRSSSSSLAGALGNDTNFQPKVFQSNNQSTYKNTTLPASERVPFPYPNSTYPSTSSVTSNSYAPPATATYPSSSSGSEPYKTQTAQQLTAEAIHSTDSKMRESTKESHATQQTASYSQTPTPLTNIKSAISNKTSTPPNRTTNLPAPVTPANAKRGRLAEDIIRALGGSTNPLKRKASDSPPPQRQDVPRPPPINMLSSFPPTVANSDPPSGLVQSSSTVKSENESVALLTSVPIEAPISSVAPPPGLLLSFEQPERPFDESPSNATAFIEELSQQSVNDVTEKENVYTPVQSSSAGPSSLAIVEPVAPKEVTPAAEPPKEPSPPATLDDMHIPLFLPSREASGSPDIEQVQLPLVPSKTESFRTVPGPTPGMTVYVEIPPPPWRRRPSRREYDPKGKRKEIGATREFKNSTLDSKRKETEKERSWSALQRLKKNVEEQALPLSIPEMLSLAHPKAVPSEPKKSAFSDVSEERKKLALEWDATASKRLIESPCRWHGCPVLANCHWKLRLHVREHAKYEPNPQEKVFVCQWGNCIRKFLTQTALAQHLVNHVRKKIPCPFKDCEQYFGHPLELLNHIEEIHDNGKSGEQKRSAALIKEPRKRVSRPLGTMLSYHAVDIPVRTQPISKEARAKLGPWVIKNMFGIVNFPIQKAKFRRPGAGGPSATTSSEGAVGISGIAPDRYDFLEPWTVKYPTTVLASIEDMHVTTAELKSGLVLMPDRFGPRGPLKEIGLTARAERVKAASRRRYILKPEGEEGMDGMDVDVKEEKLEENQRGQTKAADNEKSEDMGTAALAPQQESELVEVEAIENQTQPSFAQETVTAVSVSPRLPEPDMDMMHVDVQAPGDNESIQQNNRFRTQDVQLAAKTTGPTSNSEPTLLPVQSEDPSSNLSAPQPQLQSSQIQSTALVPFDARITELWNHVLALRYMH